MITVILAVFVVLLIAFLWKRETKQDVKTSETTIPGPSKDDKEFLNFDPVHIGKQIDFLQKLLKRYGPIARFWQGDQMSVIISTPEMFKETRHLSSCPGTLAEPFRILTDGQSFPFQSQEEILHRRKLYDQQLSMRAVKTHFDILKGVAEEFALKWQDGDQIPLLETMNTVSQKSVLRATFGDAFADDKKLESFKTEYNVIMKNLGITLSPEKEEIFKTALKKMKTIVREAYEIRREELKNGAETHIFIDVLLEDHIPEIQRDSDGLVFFLGSGTVTFSLIQLLYRLVNNQQYQDKIYEELTTVLGDGSVTLENYSQLTYLRQVIDENLRYEGVFFAARKAEKDMTIGGYSIPKGTPIMQGLGSVHRDPKYWKNPNQFDPDNFSPENSKGRHAYAFKPFGFAGKRICPGMNFSIMLLIIMSAVWLKKFKFTPPPGEAFVVSEIVGFTETVDKEIQITVSRRD